MTDLTYRPQFETLSARFKRFAELECRNNSPLYERLALGIAADPEILALAANAREDQPLPNLFFGAVHLLLLDSKDHPLAAFYPSASPVSDREKDAYPYFRSFCLDHSKAIIELVRSHLVQTNEVSRSACLMPAFCLMARQAGNFPLSLVEIGASAGLNLLWHHYGYDYGERERYGDPSSPVQIISEFRGLRRPTIPLEFPKVALRLGLDLNPIDVCDPQACLWLRALVWPEHRDRAELLMRALEMARQHPTDLKAGDALDLLPEVLPDIPPDTALCIYHTHTLNQFSSEARERLSYLFAEHSKHRELFVISIEWTGGAHPQLQLASFDKGKKTERLLGYCDPHGKWLEWLGG